MRVVFRMKSAQTLSLIATDALGKQAHYAEAMLTWESFGFPTKFNI